MGSFYLHTGCCLSQLLLSELSIWMSTLLLQQVMQQQVSLCLPVCLSRILRLSSRGPRSASPAFSSLSFVLTPIIMRLPNGIHLESTFSTLCKHLYFSGLDILPLFPTQSDCNRRNRESSSLLSLFLLFTAKALTVLLLTSLGKMDTLTFHTLKCGSAWYYL